jgi:uncharacterized protein (TIGR02147 family)
MKPVFEYLDYRAYLKDYYDERKSRQSFFSYKVFGKKVGLDGSYLAKVLIGARHIADESVKAFTEACDLAGKEAEYFEVLVLFAKSKTEPEEKVHFERLLNLKNVGAQQLLANQFEYYKTWYHSAIRSILEYFDFRGDYAELAEGLSPPVTVKEAEESIALLTALGLIEPDAEGRYRVTNANVTTGPQWRSLAIESFQEESLRLSRESIKRHPKHVRDLSTVTMTINAKDYIELRDRIKEFRGSVINYVNRSTDPDRTYQMNIQLFPLTRIGDVPK